MISSSDRSNATGSNGRIRIMIVDEHARVRHGLGVFLSTCPGLTVVAEAGTGAEALDKFETASPAVVVVDLATPGMDTAVISRRMKELAPACQIIALAAYVDPETERRVLDAGALCCLLKDSSAATLVEAIRRAPHPGRRDPSAYDATKRAGAAEDAPREVLMA